MTEIDYPHFKLLPWDSEHFGFPVARIKRLREPFSEIPMVMSALSQHGVRLAYWEAPAANPISRQVAEKCGGKFINSRIEFRISVERKYPGSDLRSLNSPNCSERQALEQLALASGWTSRFALDPKFGRQQFERLYLSWIENSLSGQIADAVLVIGDGNSIEGMITVRAENSHGEIGLVSVSESKRGTGIGRRLLRGGLHWFASKGCETVSVTTQGENGSAVALYISAGFEIHEQVDVFHFWFSET